MEGQEAAERQRPREQRFADVDFEEAIRPKLGQLTLEELHQLTGLSTGCLGEIRRGKKVPNLRHWEELAAVQTEG